MQLPVTDSTPNTRPRHETVPPSPAKNIIGEDAFPPRTRQKTPPNLVRRPSFPVRVKQTGSNIPVIMESKVVGFDSAENAERLPDSVSNGCYTPTTPRETMQQSQKAVVRSSEYCRQIAAILHRLLCQCKHLIFVMMQQRCSSI